MQPHNQTTLAGIVLSDVRPITNGKGEVIKNTFTVGLDGGSDSTSRTEQFYVECCARDLIELMKRTQKGDPLLIVGRLINRAGGDAGIRASAIYPLSLDTSEAEV